MPAFGRTNFSDTTASLVALTEQLARKDMFAGFGTHSYPDIVELRNFYLTFWFDCYTVATHLLMVDADMQFEPELVFDMLEADKPLIGAIYPAKTLPIKWVGSVANKDYLPDPNTNLIGDEDLEGLGCGVMLIRRDCVQAMLDRGVVQTETHIAHGLGELIQKAGGKRRIRAFDLVTDGDRRLSEDFSFCWRHRKAGGKLYAPVNHRVGHLGVMNYSASHGDGFVLKNGDYFRKEPWKATKETRNGIFSYNINDTFIGKSLDIYGEWCQFELDLLSGYLKDGDTVVDAGANIGTHAVAFGRLVGPTGAVHAFEPQPSLYSLLTENLIQNELRGVKAYCQALGSVTESIHIPDLPPPTVAFNFGAVPLDTWATDYHPAEMVTIDSLKLPACHLIKVDVEGMEDEVLLGAKETILKYRPVLYVECNTEDGPKKLAGVFEEFGYRVYWSIGSYYNKNNFLKNDSNVWPKLGIANLLALDGEVPCGLEPFIGANDSWEAALSRMRQPVMQT